MSKNKLILVVSDKMNNNTKRNEDDLIRMSATTRENMKFEEDKVKVWTNDKIEKSVLLTIFQAYSFDLKKLRKNKGLTTEEINRVGFITSKTYNKIVLNKKPKDVWISDFIEDTIMGSDPEFLLFCRDTSAVIRANNILPKEGILGSDGAMAEVRPEPATTPENAVENIRKVFSDTKMTEKIQDYKWASGCYFKDNVRDYPIGGHIHIGNPLQVSKLPEKEKMNLFHSMNRIIDELVSIPMMKLDGAEKGGSRRTNCTMGNYGYFGNWRPSDGHFEHRTLSGMWLMHPTIATAVIGTMKAVVDEIFLRAHNKDLKAAYIFPSKFEKNLNSLWNTFEYWSDIPLVNSFKCIQPSVTMKQILNESKATQITKTFLKNWLSRMKKMSTYDKNREYIETLYEILHLPFKRFNEGDNEIQNNWLKDKEFIV